MSLTAGWAGVKKEVSIIMEKKSNVKIKSGKLEQAKRPRGGQPGNTNARKAKPKSRMISIRLADPDLATLELAAGSLGLSLAEYCRRKILL